MRNAKAPMIAETQYVTTGEIFGDIGFSPSEAMELTIKSDLHIALMDRIRASKRTQAELAEILQIHQPDVSNLLRGKLHLFSITKLCQYADRLNLRVRVQVEDAQHNVSTAQDSDELVLRRVVRKPAPAKRITRTATAMQRPKTGRRVIA